MPVETPSDRVLPIEEFFRERLVYDRDAAFLLVFVIAKIAAAKRNAHHIEVAGAALDRDRDRQIARSGKLGAFDVNRAVVVIETERKIISQRSVFDLRQSLRTLEHLLLKGATACFVIALQADVERNRDGVFWIEAGPHLLSGLQTAHNEAGADEQNQREADLRDNEKVAQT